MDLYAESSSDNRIVAARHISADKPLPHTNNGINSSVLCHSYSLQPHFDTYLAALSTYAWVLWSCGLVVLVTVCALYFVTLRSALRHWKHNTINVTVVLAVYPLVAAAGFLAIIVPRARLIAEAVAQETVMIAMYHMYSMIIAECGGADHIVRQGAGEVIETRVLPCCCWPCCVIPRPKLQKPSLKWMRCLVFQMPIIQTIIYIIILTMWAEDMSVYLQCFTYLQPFVAASILTGIWAMMMSLRLVERAGHNPRPRFLALQLVLIIVKLQCGFAKLLPEVVNFPCIVPLNPSVFANMIQNSLMMLEMLLLSTWAWRLYSSPPGKTLDKAVRVSVAVLDDSTKTMDLRSTDVDSK